MPLEPRLGLGLFAATFVACLCFAYGGTRSADGEIMYRVGRSLALHGTAAVDPLERWPEFGIARGQDGKAYAIYGPVLSLALVPAIAVASRMAPLVPGIGADRPSFHLDDGLRRFMRSERAEGPGHDERFVVALLVPPFLTAFLVVVWARFLAAFACPPVVTVTGCFVLLLCTPVLSYGTTFFAEPLATAFLLLSLHALVHRSSDGAAVVGGLWLALAVSTHLSFAVFGPFLAALPLARRQFRRAAAFVAAAAVCLVPLGLYDLVRFGSLFETGRGLPPASTGQPWDFTFDPIRLGRLLVSSGKGLVPFCPIVLVALACWPALERHDRVLARCLAAAAVGRVLFVGSYNHWHGGFCLGPRLLYGLLPLLLLAVPLHLMEWRRSGRRRVLAAFVGVVVICMAQQVYFAVGVVFHVSHYVVAAANSQGTNVFVDDALYVDPQWSPLGHLHLTRRGPWLLHDVPCTNLELWLGLSCLAALVLVPLARRLVTTDDPSPS